MKVHVAVATAAILGLSACGGSHVSALPSKSVAPQTHVRHMLSDRRPKDVLGGTPVLSLKLVLFDAPLVGANAANSQFNAGILGVDAIDTNGDSWQLVANQSAQVVNLLELQSSSLDLGTGSLPAGSYPAVQLLLDPATTSVTYNGATYPVVFVDPNHPWWDPTQMVEAVSVPLSVSGNGGDSIVATLDFNVFQSADLRDGVVYLTPTVAGGVASPTISGSVVNNAGGPVVNATVVATDGSGNVANTTITGADGSFHLRGINPGGYTISVMNAYTTKAGATVTASGNDAGAAPSTYVVVGPNSQESLQALRD